MHICYCLKAIKALQQGFNSSWEQSSQQGFNSSWEQGSCSYVFIMNIYENIKEGFTFKPILPSHKFTSMD